jgi:hypothetical protein
MIAIPGTFFRRKRVRALDSGGGLNGDAKLAPIVCVVYPEFPDIPRDL